MAQRRFHIQPCKFDDEGFLVSPNRATAASKRVVVPKYVPAGDLDQYFHDVQTNIFNAVFESVRKAMPYAAEHDLGIIVDYCHLIISLRAHGKPNQELFPGHVHLVGPAALYHVEIGVGENFEVARTYSAYPKGTPNLLEQIITASA